VPHVSGFETWGLSAPQINPSNSTHEIDRQKRHASSRIRCVTAPHPIFWVPHQAPSHRIAMHVLQFLPPFLRAPNVKVIKPRLPKAGDTRQAHSLGDTELQALNHSGGIAGFRLAHEQVNMFGHHHVAHQSKTVLGTHFVENLDKSVAGVLGSQQGESTVATEGDEMQVSGPIVTLEISGHGSKEAQNPHVSETETWGTHEFSRGKLPRCYPPPTPRRVKGNAKACPRPERTP